MPELPEVEIICQGLASNVINTTIEAVTVKQRKLRFPLPCFERFEKTIQKEHIISISRRAKYIRIHLSNNLNIITHLGMTGKFYIDTKQKKEKLHEKHTHIIFYLSNNKTLSYNDIRRFGYMDIVTNDNIANHSFFKNLGIEPLSQSFTPEYLYQLTQKSKAPIKSFLLDQTKICGIGNIYANEILWRACLHPQQNTHTLSDKIITIIHKHTKNVLQEAIQSGGSTLQNFSNINNNNGYFQHHFQVYNRNREKCLRKTCNGTIQKIIIAGRSSFFCYTCQKNHHTVS